ncbi:MAG TPA: 4Fe-4S binding protein [Candidatus Alistipes intestinigallinarum]|uniref:4Fe-4S binding protein n=1 Tax=Candidatus Alistipes intestinigallinarum TaxID=2838440 RepID=A0A9D1Z0B5_9BACT|nr:4Fe-4S binding protein [Candidatus Alistipes intestinigallinarum]
MPNQFYDSIRSIFFSPTGTSKKIAEAITRGVAAPTDESTLALTVQTLDLTHTAGPETTLSAETVAVIAAPVYGGRIAPVAMKRLAGIRGSGGPAVVVALYGNRAFEHAVVELAGLVSRQGFVPVAAAAFVGEHSYSTPETPIAAGRPDAQDLTAAEAFGRAIRQKLDAGTCSPVDAAQLKERRAPSLSTLRFIRFVLKYRRQQKRHPVVYLPECDAERCTLCGRCAAICPVGAISRGDETRTDPARCIRCCACVKGCPVGARTFHTPFAEALSRNFFRRKEPVTLL